MDIESEEFIKNTCKHTYLFAGRTKAAIVSRGKHLKDAREYAMDKISEKIDKVVNVPIIRITLKKISQRLLKKDREGPLSVLGGPVAMIITVYRVTEKGAFVIDDNEGRSNRIYVTQDYLDDYCKIQDKHLKRIARNIIMNKVDTRLFSVNKIEKYI